MTSAATCSPMAPMSPRSTAAAETDSRAASSDATTDRPSSCNRPASRSASPRSSRRLSSVNRSPWRATDANAADAPSSPVSGPAISEGRSAAAHRTASPSIPSSAGSSATVMLALSSTIRHRALVLVRWTSVCIVRSASIHSTTATAPSRRANSGTNSRRRERRASYQTITPSTTARTTPAATSDSTGNRPAWMTRVQVWVNCARPMFAGPAAIHRRRVRRPASNISTNMNATIATSSQLQIGSTFGVRVPCGVSASGSPTNRAPLAWDSTSRSVTLNGVRSDSRTSRRTRNGYVRRSPPASARTSE